MVLLLNTAQKKIPLKKCRATFPTITPPPKKYNSIIQNNPLIALAALHRIYNLKLHNYDFLVCFSNVNIIYLLRGFFSYPW